MSYQDRADLIAQIESSRGSKVLVYLVGDRPPVPAQLGDDAVRPLIEHLRGQGRVEKLDVFIYSKGGAIDVPWRLNTAFRAAAEHWNALIPFRANSAATLLALGADSIVLGRQGELGPIDPEMTFQRPGPSGPIQDKVGVEDVMAYAKFVRDRGGLSDQAALSQAFTKLTERLDPVVLGSAFRTHSHIRYVARHMLLSRSGERTGTEAAIDTIVETLAERVYAHGHAIGLEEAKEMDLHVESANDDIDGLMWDLLRSYERALKLLEPLDPSAAVEGSDRYEEEAVIAVIESTYGVHEFHGRIVVNAQRQLPPNLQVQLNMPVQLPSGVDPGQLPPAIQQMLQAAQQQLLAAAQTAVQEALRAQAPLIGANVRFLDGMWRKRVDSET